MSENMISPDGQWKWNGTEWVPNEAVAPTPPPPAPAKKRKKWPWIVGGSVAALILIGAMGSGSETDTAAPEPTETASSIETVEPAEEPSEEPVEEVSEEPSEEPEAPAVTTPKKKAHDALSERDFAKLMKDPDAHVGEYIVVYAEVTQFDSATGTDTFRGDAASKDARDPGDDYWWYQDNNAIFTGDEADFDDVITDDIVKVWATVGGSLSYDTQIGGSTTVPVFLVNHIEVIG